MTFGFPHDRTLSVCVLVLWRGSVLRGPPHPPHPTLLCDRARMAMSRDRGLPLEPNISQVTSWPCPGVSGPPGGTEFASLLMLGSRFVCLWLMVNLDWGRGKLLRRPDGKHVSQKPGSTRTSGPPAPPHAGSHHGSSLACLRPRDCDQDTEATSWDLLQFGDLCAPACKTQSQVFLTPEGLKTESCSPLYPRDSESVCRSGMRSERICTF